MASLSIKIGDAFLLPDEPPKNRHLYIAIAEVSQGSYLFVNATTRKDNSEHTCILSPGKGVPNFIKHESVIAYKHARVIEAKKIHELLADGACTQEGSCSNQLVARIQQGGINSKQIKNKLKRWLQEYLDGKRP